MIGINVYSLFDNNMEHVSNNQYQDNVTAQCSGQDPIKLSHSASDENLHYLDIWYRGSWAGTDWWLVTHHWRPPDSEGSNALQQISTGRAKQHKWQSQIVQLNC